MPPKRKAQNERKSSSKKRRNVLPGRDPYVSSDDEEKDTPKPLPIPFPKVRATPRKQMPQDTRTKPEPAVERLDLEKAPATNEKALLLEAPTAPKPNGAKGSIKVAAKTPPLKTRKGEESEDEDVYDEDGMNILEEDDEGEDGEEGAEGGETISKSEKLANAIAKILSAGSSVVDQHRPILAKEPQIERSLDDAKLEHKARKLIAAEKKKLSDIGRSIPTHATTDYEKKLRKVATRGVVQLFNAIRIAQKTSDDIKQDGIQKNLNVAPIVSKNTFLEMLKGGPTGAANKEVERETAVSQKSKDQGGVPWVKNDYGMKAPKHWDEEEEEEEEVELA